MYSPLIYWIAVDFNTALWIFSDLSSDTVDLIANTWGLVRKFPNETNGVIMSPFLVSFASLSLLLSSRSGLSIDGRSLHYGSSQKCQGSMSINNSLNNSYKVLLSAVGNILFSSYWHVLEDYCHFWFKIPLATDILILFYLFFDVHTRAWEGGGERETEVQCFDLIYDQVSNRVDFWFLYVVRFLSRDRCFGFLDLYLPYYFQNPYQKLVVLQLHNYFFCFAWPIHGTSNPPKVTRVWILYDYIMSSFLYFFMWLVIQIWKLLLYNRSWIQ